MKTIKQAMKAILACAMVGFAAEAVAQSWKVDGSYLVEQGVDTPWEFKISTSGGNITIASGNAVKGASTVADFTNIEGGTLTGLASYAFRGSYGYAITEYVFPESLTAIASDVFNSNTTVQKITLSSKTTSIGLRAFSGCTALETVTPFLPETLTSLGANVFDSCAKLTDVLELTSLTSAGTYVFKLCNGLAEVHIGSGVTLSADMFNSCTGLRDLWFDGAYAQSGDPFRSVNKYQFRVHYPKGDPSWATKLASNFKAWDALPPTGTAPTQATYTSVFGTDELPEGMINGGTPNTQWVMSYVKQVTGKDLTVATEVAGIGVPNPAYGEQGDVSAQLPLTCSNSQYGVKDNILYECWGAEIVRLVEGVPTDCTTNESRAVEFNPTEGGAYRLTWLWRKVGYKSVVQLSTTLPLGSVTEVTVPSVEGCYLAGEPATFTATAEGDGTFVKWYGDVPEDQAKNPTVTVTMDRVRTLKPYFRCPYWVFNSTKPSITDGYWELYTVGTDTNALVVGSRYADGSNASALIVNGVDPILDLSKPVQGGTIVGIYKCAFRNSNMRFSEIWLPKTLASIGSIAFGDKSVGTTRVVFKSYPTISGDAFDGYGANAMLWTIPNDGSWDEFLASPATFTPWTASMKSAWKFDGPKPLGKTVGFGCQWVRYPVGGMKLLFR